LREYPREGGALLLQQGIFKEMMVLCAANHAGIADFEPDRVVALYLNCFARASIEDPFFLDAILPISFSQESIAFSSRDLVSGDREQIGACICRW
jgi:hypothetical protein